MKLSTSIVSTEWLLKHIDHPDVVILDASIPKVKANSSIATPQNLQIENARFFDLKNSFRDTNNPLPNTKPSPEQFSLEAQKLGINNESCIVIYDDIGIYSSPRAWWLFKAMGHQNVAVLDGGLVAWKEANLACENKKPYIGKTGNFKANYQAALFTDINRMVDNLDRQEQLVIDARSNGRFHAIDPEPRASLRGGHIPHSKSLAHSRVVIDGKLVSSEDLVEVFSALNVDHKPLVFTCGSGITACIIALAAEQAGYQDLSVYDGSWTEWGGSDLPIEI